MNQAIIKSLTLPDGKTITIETGRLARQADGAVVVKMGDTMLLATVVSAKEAKEGVDFLPLSVEYKEKFASTGKFPGGFLKRETRPSDSEVLVCRLIDRVLRPLFPSDYHSDTFVTVNLISADKDIIPDTLACLAASAAIMVSDIPFMGPVAETRIGRVNDNWVMNPTYSELKESDFDMVVGATTSSIVMVEGELDEVSENEMLRGIKLAHEHIKLFCKLQKDLEGDVEKANPKRNYLHETNDDSFKDRIFEKLYDQVYEVAKSGLKDKLQRYAAFNEIKDSFADNLTEEEKEGKAGMLDKYYDSLKKKAVQDCILKEKIRLDGRKHNEVRDIWCEVDFLPAPHGSAIFTRGETQSLTTVTLGSKLDEQRVDSALIQTTENFILHYNFPPFSTGDARPVRGISRREVGHGNLALRALKVVIPDEKENPYTIRLVSDILESNGSSSMATVCAGTLALMDAGIKIKRPVSGIAMGLIMGDDGDFAVLSDILGDEDHLGHMDFKVTGTEKGITACQMDIKIEGISYEVLEKALHQANEGRAFILSKMLEEINVPREDYKPHVPRIEKLFIDKEFIGAVIGPGGKVIQEIQRETGTVITIEEVGEQGIVEIMSSDRDSSIKAVEWVERIIAVPEIGEVYDGIIKSVQPYGAFIEFMPGHQALLHVSEIEWHRVESAEGVLKEGEKIKVKLIGKDKRTGKLKLSRKVLLPKPETESSTI